MKCLFVVDGFQTYRYVGNIGTIVFYTYKSFTSLLLLEINKFMCTRLFYLVEVLLVICLSENHPMQP